MYSHPSTRAQTTAGMLAETLWGTSVGTNRGGLCWSQRLRGSQMIIPPSPCACTASHSRLIRLETGWSEKRILNHALKLWREQGDDRRVAFTLRELSDANRVLGLCKEG